MAEAATLYLPTRAKKLTYTQEELRLMRETIIPKEVPDMAFKHLVYLAERTGADIFLGQIHTTPRWNKQLGRMVWMPQLSVHGLSLLANRAKNFAGTDPCRFTYKPDGSLESAVVTVYKMVEGSRVPFSGTALYDEYVQKNDKGLLIGLWKDKPHRMLEKCSYANALRQAWQEETGGLYIDEEMPLETGRVTAFPAHRALPEPEEQTIDPKVAARREQLINGVKRICKDYSLASPNEDLYSLAEEAIIAIGKKLRAEANEIDEQRAAQAAQVETPVEEPEQAVEAEETAASEPMATKEQIASLGKLCDKLEKERPAWNTLSHAEAARLIVAYSREFNAHRGTKQGA